MVGGVLEHHPQRLGDGVVVEGADLQSQQGAGPVDGLGDRRRLLQLQLAEAAKASRRRLSIGLLGNAAEVLPEVRSWT